MSISYLLLLLCISTGIDALVCKNETIKLKSSWALTPADYTIASLCYKKFLIPEDSYVETDIYVESILTTKEKDAWYVFENSFGFTVTSDESQYNYNGRDAVHLPPPYAYFIFYQPNPKKAIYIRTVALTLKPLVINVTKTVDLEKDALLTTATDIIQPSSSLRLVSNDQIWLTTTCESLGFWLYESPWPNDPEVMNLDAEKIWIFQDYGNRTETIDSLHTNFFRTNSYSSPIILTTTSTSLSCIFLALSKSRREYFQQVRLGYAVNAANYINEQEYILNATEKPFALVAISRKFGNELFVNWLLPTVIPEGAKLLIYGGFPSATDNSSQLEYEFTGTIETPQFIGGLIRTFVLTSGIAKIKLSDKCKFNFPLPPNGITLNIKKEQKSMITTETSQSLFFAVQEKGLLYTFDFAVPGNNTDYGDAIIIYPEPIDMWNPGTMVYPSEIQRRDFFMNGGRMKMPQIDTVMKLTIKESRTL